VALLVLPALLAPAAVEAVLVPLSYRNPRTLE
jgi:hypothetical protein